VKALLLRAIELYAKTEKDIERTGMKKVYHKHTGYKPIKGLLRRVPLITAQQTYTCVLTVVERIIFQYASSPWSSRVILVEKKECGLR